MDTIQHAIFNFASVLASTSALMLAVTSAAMIVIISTTTNFPKHNALVPLILQAGRWEREPGQLHSQCFGSRLPLHCPQDDGGGVAVTDLG